MARSIEEVGQGDYVKVGPGRWEEIRSVSKEFRPGTTELRRWTITTASGRTVGMFEAHAYAKWDDPR